MISRISSDHHRECRPAPVPAAAEVIVAAGDMGSKKHGGVSRTLDSEYDPGGRRTRLTFPDANYFSHEYDAAGRLTTIRENGATEVASFGYDHLGRRADASFSGTITSTTTSRASSFSPTISPARQPIRA